MITNPPQDTTVVEGGNATFQCMGVENGVAVILGWLFTPSGSATSIVLITGTNLTGIETVIVSDEGGGRRNGGVCCIWLFRFSDIWSSNTYCPV